MAERKLTASEESKKKNIDALIYIMLHVRQIKWARNNLSPSSGEL